MKSLQTGSRVEVMIDGVEFIATIVTKGIKPSSLHPGDQVRVQITGSDEYKTILVKDILSTVSA